VVSIDSHEILDVFSSSPILLVIPARNWTMKVSPSLLCMVRHTLVPVCLPSLWALICFLLIGRPCRLPLFLVHYAISYRHTFFEILTPLSARRELSPYSLWHFVRMIVHPVVFIHCLLLLSSLWACTRCLSQMVPIPSHAVNA
jgi:hypothetical protein